MVDSALTTATAATYTCARISSLLEGFDRRDVTAVLGRRTVRASAAPSELFSLMAEVETGLNISEGRRNTKQTRLSLARGAPGLSGRSGRSDPPLFAEGWAGK